MPQRKQKFIFVLLFKVWPSKPFLYVGYLSNCFLLMKFRTFITPLAVVGGLVFCSGLTLLTGIFVT
jgi:hypothetical protein